MEQDCLDDKIVHVTRSSSTSPGMTSPHCFNIFDEEDVRDKEDPAEQEPIKNELARAYKKLATHVKSTILAYELENNGAMSHEPWSCPRPENAQDGQRAHSKRTLKFSEKPLAGPETAQNGRMRREPKTIPT